VKRSGGAVIFVAIEFVEKTAFFFLHPILSSTRNEILHNYNYNNP
jgi:hypothetical protein